MIGDTFSKVAVLLAAYNGERWLLEQVESILHQEYVNPTIFISLDLSDDESLALCQKLAEQNVNIELLSYGERFGGAGKNFFRLIRDVDFSEFDYVAFADQDDMWLPDKLFTAIDAIQKNNRDAYSSDVTAFWENGREEVIVKSQPQTNFDYLFEAAGPGCTYVLTFSSLLRFKQFLLDNPKADDFKLHDWLIYAFYRRQGFKWLISDQPKMRYRQHANNQVGFNKGFKAYKTRISQVLDKRYRMEVEKLIDLLGVPTEFTFQRNYLIKNFNELRRRKRDAYVLLVLNLLGWF